MNLSRDYDATTLQEQKTFLKELGPYHTLAAKDSKYAFLTRVKKLWFLRWPLKLAQYIDFQGMCHREDQIWKVNIPPSMLLPPVLLYSDSDMISRVLKMTLCGQVSLLR
jgi:hypothetical protein